MNIHEVENMVGLSKKSIRYYEENGLLNPKRNKDNDYRIYSDKDVERLKVIKFLRELGVPIRDLKKLNDGTFSLEECMEDRIDKIRREEENYQKIINMCEEIRDTRVNYQDIDITSYFREVNVLNKEGFTMRDVSDDKRNKIMGAILSSVIFGLFFLFIVGIVSYFQFTEVEKMPWILYWFLIVIFLFPLISIGYNLVIRIKEIKGGEEDEASKY